jgi:uncharacterized membrane protein YgcG
MRDAIVFLLILCAACGTVSNKSEHLSRPFVVDSGHVFLPEQVTKLQDLLLQQAAAKGDTITVMTITNYQPAADLHEYAVRYFNDHNTEDKTNWNRVLIVFCADCHGVEVLTGKTGHTIATTENIKTIIDSVMVPRFRMAQDYDGLMNGCNAIIALLNGKP